VSRFRQLPKFTSKLAKSDVSDIGRDPHGLTTEICVKISVVGVVRVFHHNSFLSFILVLELY